jgi:large subunit ribosomal protein L30
MIAAIRIRGRVGVSKEIEDTLYLLKLRKKFVCSLYPEDKTILGMLNKVKAYVAYGKINDDTLRALIEKRGRKEGNKRLSQEEVEKIFNEIKKGKKLKELEKEYGLKPFFRLAPPKHGFKKSIKLLWPKGILGNIQEEINNLILRML